MAGADSVPHTRGRVTAVTARTIRLEAADGRSREIVTSQSYTERVFPGQNVTVWYRQIGGAEKLDRIEYPLEYLAARPEEFLPPIKRVILLPASNAGDAGEIFAAIERRLEADRHWVVASRLLSEEVRRRDQKARGVNAALTAPANPYSPAPIESASPELIRKVADAARADAVLETRVEYSVLPVRSHTAEWDGQREKFGSTSGRITMAMTLRKVEGRVPVATIVLRLFDRQGKLLWNYRRGFGVLALQVSSKNEFRDRPLAERARDVAFMEAWLASAFMSWQGIRSEPAMAIAKD